MWDRKMRDRKMQGEILLTKMGRLENAGPNWKLPSLSGAVAASLAVVVVSASGRLLYFITAAQNHIQLEMWDNSQRDSRPVEYRWRPLFNAAKFGWRPLPCSNTARRESRWNLQGCLKLANRSQPLVGLSSPYYADMLRRYRCLTGFFPIVDTCLSCDDAARQSCVMVPKWRFFASCIFSEPRAAHFRRAF